MSTHQGRLVAAFAVIYLVWGSTYLAIRVALEAWPPFLLAGTRFLVAGLLLLLLARRRGAAWPTARQWAACGVTGAFLFLAGNGLVCWAEQEVASGVAALAVATVPVWMTLIPAPGVARTATNPMTWLGVALGLGAVAILALPGAGLQGPVPAIPLMALLAAAACWATGSHLTLRLPRASSPFATSGAQMLCGGAWATFVGLLRGEGRAFDPGSLTESSAAAWLYLVLFGSVLAVSAYGWLLHETTPSAIGTYAFVNPVVAVVLGWALGGELVGPRTIVSLTLVVISVALILRGRSAGRFERPLVKPQVAALLALALLLPARTEASAADAGWVAAVAEAPPSRWSHRSR